MNAIFSDETEENLNNAMRGLSMELVTDPGQMLDILNESKEQGTAVGIFASILGQEIFVTAVADILIDKEITVVLKNYDITGYMLETNKLRLSEIKSICPFKSSFENPYMKSTKHSK